MDIQKLRTDRGWTQEQLALHSGLSPRTIQRLESGNAATLESLKCLAAVFETSVTNLMQEPKMIPDSSPPRKTDKPEAETTSDAQNTGQETNKTFQQRKEAEAIDYVQNLKGFHLHWMCFVVIIPCLYALNLYTSPNNIWIGWVIAPRGLGIALHAIMLFGLFGLFGAKWEQRQFQRRMGLYD
ncbi:MAG: helix-turn-helix domain-containing protein [Alphaproteobacteria bacterium]|nr:helix-turn-helix domain-containing protein [Alphaproteobacteria bacterium]